MAATETLNLRVQPAIRDLIDRAAESTGRNRTEFILSAAYREAEAVLLDQRLFRVDADQFEAFRSALEQPPGDLSRLRQTLNAKAPWDQ